jgi:superfamily II DNA or RNA helicase
VDKVHLRKIDETYLKVEAEPAVVQELSDVFTFEVPGAKFMPAVKNRFWDGKIRLLNSLTGATYAGLADEIERFCKVRDYEFSRDDSLKPQGLNLTDEQIVDFLQKIKVTMAPRLYQVEAFRQAVRCERGVFVSPTASGKSFIIYLIARFFGLKTLIIVPTTSLVSQLASDFKDYGYDSEKNVHAIYSGQTKSTDKIITISTWQSIFKLPKTWFDEYDMIIGDEAHQFKAKSLTSIMEKAGKIKYRFGFTGTLDGSMTNEITLTGLFGSVHQVTTTKELMDDGKVAKLKIKVIIYNHSKEDKKLCSKMSYHDEVDWLVSNPNRNKFLRNLTLSLNGNTLLLFQFVDKHGKLLYDMIRSKAPDRKVFFIHGGVDADEREAVRRIVEKESDAVIVASYGTFSTGVNIRNLHNVVFTSPTKSRIRTLQSIGRGLRLSETKDAVTVYDIGDDLRHGDRTNYTLQHLTERMEIYNSEDFEYKIYTVNS